MKKVFGGNKESGESCNLFNSVVALSLSFGAIHFNVSLILFALFFLPLSKALLIFGFLILFAVLPVDKDSLLGQKLSRFICKHVCSYFPITLHLEDAEAFHLNQTYVFCYEPHSIFPLGIFALHENVGFMPIPNIRFLVSTASFYIPFLRQVWTWLGYSSVEKKNLISLLEAGHSCIIVPGGNRETLFMEHGCETNIYNWWKVPGKVIQNLARSMKIFPLIFWGIFGSPIPFKKPLYVAVGRPIQLQKNPEPTIEQVAKVHSEFIKALQDLFERHKAQAGCENLELKIV
ncbi:unnamed protein product [Trifolium pratense]|uniref:Uncharacterized protein n=1 Tax=Trifolium pratense TaxID=57577 RepID=A0ACB0IVP6_TRIPR|nr:unnamed protein product [Trifolium pratense]